MRIHIEQAGPADASIITDMVGQLLHEIMAALAEPVFGFDPMATQARAREWIMDGRSMVWLARHDSPDAVLGFVAIYESYALYAEGAFGTISELYVRPSFRSRGVGGALVEAVRQVAKSRGWTRLEVTTPPLPQFDRSLAFYARLGFTQSGGRKLKATLR